MVKELYSRPWDFTVYQTNDGFVISVIFFGLVDFHRSFKITSDEIPADLEDLKTLSEKIRSNYEDFIEREISPAITD